MKIRSAILSTPEPVRWHKRPLRSSVRLTVAIALLATTAVAGLSARPADATPTSTNPPTAAVQASGKASYTPQEGTVFNDPKSKKKARAISDTVEAAIKAAPPKSTIRTAQYLFDLNSTEKALTDAYRRGVRVQVLVDDGETDTSVIRLRALLGSDRSKPSFVFSCKRGCMSSVRSTMHAKMYLFSQSGTAAQVAMISSANPYGGNVGKSWNDLQTIVGNQAIWKSLNQYFVDMLLDKTNYNYYRTTITPEYSLYFFPRKTPKGADAVPQLTALKKVKCTGVKAGYGYRGKTAIRVAMWGWTKTRTDVAAQLWKLHNQGCNVYVVLNKARTSRVVFQALLKPSAKYGVLPVYDMWFDPNGDDVAEFYMHQKLLMINGNVDKNPATKVLWTGSQNFTEEGSRVNNEVLMRINKDSVHDAYAINLATTRDKYAKGKITKVPSKRYYEKPKNQSTITSLDGTGRERFDDYALPPNGDVDFDR